MAVKWMLLWVLLFAVPASAQYGANWNASRWTAAKDAAHGENPVAQVGVGSVALAPEVGTPALITLGSAPDNGDTEIGTNTLYMVDNQTGGAVYLRPDTVAYNAGVTMLHKANATATEYYSRADDDTFDVTATDDLCLTWRGLVRDNTTVGLIAKKAAAAASSAGWRLYLDGSGHPSIGTGDTSNGSNAASSLTVATGTETYVAACYDHSADTVDFYVGTYDSEGAAGTLDSDLAVAVPGGAAVDMSNAAPLLLFSAHGASLGDANSDVNDVGVFVATQAGDIPTVFAGLVAADYAAGPGTAADTSLTTLCSGWDQWFMDSYTVVGEEADDQTGENSNVLARVSSTSGITLETNTTFPGATGTQTITNTNGVTIYPSTTSGYQPIFFTGSKGFVRVGNTGGSSGVVKLIPLQ